MIVQRGRLRSGHGTECPVTDSTNNTDVVYIYGDMLYIVQTKYLSVSLRNKDHVLLHLTKQYLTQLATDTTISGL